MSDLPIDADDRMAIRAPQSIELDFGEVEGQCLYYPEGDELELQVYNPPTELQEALLRKFGDAVVLLEGIVYVCVGVPGTITAEEYASTIWDELVSPMEA